MEKWGIESLQGSSFQTYDLPRKWIVHTIIWNAITFAIALKTKKCSLLFFQSTLVRVVLFSVFTVSYLMSAYSFSRVSAILSDWYALKRKCVTNYIVAMSAMVKCIQAPEWTSRNDARACNVCNVCATWIFGIYRWEKSHGTNACSWSWPVDLRSAHRIPCAQIEQPWALSSISWCVFSRFAPFHILAIVR